MGMRGRIRKARRAATGESNPLRMSKLERRINNIFLAVLGSLGVLFLGGLVWRPIDKAITDLIVYAPAKRGAAVDGWVNTLRDSGFHVHVVEEPHPARRRHALHLPEHLAAEVVTVTANPSTYVLSGLVPPAAIGRMLREKPSFHGLTVLDGAVPAATLEAGAMDVLSYWSDGRTQIYMHVDER